MGERTLTKQLVIRVDEATYAALQQAASENDRTPAQEVRRALRFYLSALPK